MSSHLRRSARVLPLGLLLSALLGGCKFVGASDNNLRELHSEDGRHKRSGRLLSHYSYATRVGVMGLLRSVGVKPKEADVSRISDPLEVCVRTLHDLAKFDSEDDWTRALQIEHFSRIAVNDPWKLSREVACNALGRIAASAGHGAKPPVNAAGPFAEEEAVRDRLQRLIRAATAVARSEPGEELAEIAGVDAGTQPAVSVAEACRGVLELELDLEDSQRVLRLTSLLQRSRLGGDARLAGVKELRESVEHRCVSIALQSALSDREPAGGETLGSDPGWRKPSVRAAAVRACVRVWGKPVLAELLVSAHTRGDDPAPLIELMRAVERVGLPEAPATATPEQDQRMVAAWKRFVWRVAVDHPDGTVRIAALGALGKISGLGRFSLRDEDWLPWAREAGVLEAPPAPGRPPEPGASSAPEGQSAR